MEASTPAPRKLLNSLIEMCVVIGMDQDTGLISTPEKTPRPSSKSFNSSVLFNTNFVPHVIAALSGQVASFPQCSVDIDGAPYYQHGAVMGNTPVKTMVRNARRSSLIPNAGMIELPISSEVINSLPPLCFPDGGFVYSTPQDDSVHFLVLTDIEGNRTYCCCMTVYRAFGAKEETPGTYQLVYMGDPDDNKALKATDCVYGLCYVPLCCCCISKYPYFTFLKKSLSSLLVDLKKEPQKMRPSLMQFVSKLAVVPVPPAGSLAIEFNLHNERILVKPADEPDMRVVDIELHYPFLCFSVDDILFLMSCIFTQQRLIFVSSVYALLTLTIECIFTYIQPFSWSWTYVPVLPSNLLDLIEAPGAYIMGCHARNKTQIMNAMSTDEMADIVIADIDEGKVTRGRDVQVHCIPTYIAELFKFRMMKAPVHFDLFLSGRPAYTNLVQVRKDRDQFCRDFQHLILSATMEMMARIFSDMSNFTVQEELYFDLESFIESKPVEDQPFYREVCQTHAFSCFLDTRLLHPEKRDIFSTISEKNRPQPERQGPMRKRSSSKSSSPTTSNLNDVIIAQATSSDVLATFPLPAFPREGLHTGKFYDECLAELTKRIEIFDQLPNELLRFDTENKASGLLASYLYLRGMFNVSRGHKVEALEDFFAVSTRNAQLFPTETVHKILWELSKREEEVLQKKSFYRKANALRNKKKGNEWHGRERKQQVVTSAVPTNPLGEEEFLKRISMLQTTSAESGKKLFEALTSDKPNGVVDPDVFACFYNALSEADREAQAMPWYGVTPEEGEFVVIASQVIRTDRAMGRLLLTSNRLLFFVEGAFKCELIIRLEDIQEIEHITSHYTVLLLGVPALKITSRNKNVPQLIACFKENRSFWHACLNEMLAGVRISEESKDVQVGIKQAAQNVIVADALRRSGHSDSQTQQVLYLSKIEAKKLSKETKKALVVRISPTPQTSEAEKTTVEAMVFAPKTESCGEEVWCGLGSGAVVVINATTWTFVTHLRYARDRVSCLIPVGDHVWVGSMDTTIYIINRRTRQADQQLHGHADYISHMITTEEDDGSLTVWSASVNGLIIGWNPDTLTIKKSIKLAKVKTLASLIAVDDHFWCVTKSAAVLVVDRHSDDNSYKTLALPPIQDTPRSIDCMCFVPPNKIWTGCDRKGLIAVWNIETHDYTTTEIPCRGFTQLIYVDGKVWAGGRNGSLYVISAKACKKERELELHNDRVRSMCLTSTAHILTGPGSKDGRIAVWRSHVLEDKVDAPGFEVVNEEIIRERSRCQKRTR